VFLFTERKSLRPDSEPLPNGCWQLLSMSMTLSPSKSRCTSWLGCAVKVRANRGRESENAHDRVPSALICDSVCCMGISRTPTSAQSYWLFGLVTAMCRGHSARPHVDCLGAMRPRLTYKSCRSPMMEIDYRCRRADIDPVDPGKKVVCPTSGWERNNWIEQEFARVPRATD
jgi:hypothetical protein